MWFLVLVGSYSALIVTFHLRRQVGYYIMDYYVPSTLLVIISWVSFWLDANAISGRINLGQCYLIVVCMFSRNINYIYHVYYTLFHIAESLRNS